MRFKSSDVFQMVYTLSEMFKTRYKLSDRFQMMYMSKVKQQNGKKKMCIA
jgi:hypothetical protein